MGWLSTHTSVSSRCKKEYINDVDTHRGPLQQCTISESAILQLGMYGDHNTPTMGCRSWTPTTWIANGNYTIAATLINDARWAR